MAASIMINGCKYRGCYLAEHLKIPGIVGVSKDGFPVRFLEDVSGRDYESAPLKVNEYACSLKPGSRRMVVPNRDGMDV